MFPDLSYFFNYLFGTPVDNFLSIFKTFGLFLVFAFVVSAYILKIELVRKRKLGLFEGKVIEIPSKTGIKVGELISNGIFGFILGWKVPLILQDISAFSQNPTAILFSLSGSWLLGIVIAALMIGLSYYLSGGSSKKELQNTSITQYPEHRLMEITMVAAFFGILGSKLFSVFENWNSFIDDPIQQLFAGSGLTIYGGLILAFIAVYLYVKRIGIKPIHMMDAVAPALIMGYVVGRMGCQMSGDGDWGIANASACPSWIPEWLWSYNYPNNVNVVKHFDPLGGYTGKPITPEMIEAGIPSFPGYGTYLDPAVYPTPIYELALATIIFLILWRLRTRVKLAGTIISFYFILNGIERFFIEKIRVNDVLFDLGFMKITQAEVIALCFIIFGAVLLFLIRSGKISQPAPPKHIELG